MVWFQLSLTYLLLLHHLRVYHYSPLLNLVKSFLFINLKGRIHSKSAYDTTHELQAPELQLKERDAGMVTWADLQLKACFVRAQECGRSPSCVGRLLVEPVV